MNNQSKTNKEAWSHRAKEFWIKDLGEPQTVAKDMTKRPKYYLRRHIDLLGEVNQKSIINILGSCGKKAIPLALLGANVTIVDISEDNKEYAMDVAREANVDINFIVSDFLELNTYNKYDLAYLEGGILHYFSDIEKVAKKIYSLLKREGKLVLNDFHPFRKVLKERNIFKGEKLELGGDYFSSELEQGEVAYERILNNKGDEEFPKCLLRYWTMGEIITAFASVGFVVEKLIEGPRFDEHKNIPGEFTLVATKKE
ncbi:class I SAM-dependent methyltransferase [Clostridiaceae bacterium M8S5]|nr:class I SAM-dependent methyltransferase [Clostridiaceae bacterium M8S5]